jgi:hypothetical protein
MLAAGVAENRVGHGDLIRSIDDVPIIGRDSYRHVSAMDIRMMAERGVAICLSLVCNTNRVDS